MRKKTVNYDGAEFTFGALTLEQVETLLAPKDGEKTVTYRVADLIVEALNNAQNGNGAEPWTVERLRHECDLICFQNLHRDIRAFSGLPLLDKAPPGEAPATSEPSSAPSEAGSSGAVTS
ncbi:MAG TPA: hypothetical protein VJV74_04205 [Terriglobia bacterium]|nr:hypothetical protein [Terriglobia bacterium]